MPRTWKLASFAVALLLITAMDMNREQTGYGLVSCFVSGLKIDGPSEGLLGETLTFTGHATVEECSAKPSFTWKLKAAPSGAEDWSATGAQVTFRPQIAGAHLFGMEVTAGAGGDRGFSSKDFTVIAGQKAVPCPPTQSQTYCFVQGNSGSADVVNFSPDSQWVAAGGYGVIKVWETSTGNEALSLSGHAPTFSPDGKLLAFATGENTIQLWDITAGTVVRTLEGKRSGSMAFSPGGKLLASGSDNNSVGLWDVATGAIVRRLTGHAASVQSVAFSPDGKLLASGSCRTFQGPGCGQGEIKLWDVASGVEVRSITGHTDWVWNLDFSPDGKLLASGSCDKTQAGCGMVDGDTVVVKLWDVATGDLVRTLPIGYRASKPAGLAFSPNGRVIASGGFRGYKIWEVASGNEVRDLIGTLGASDGIAFSPDGKFLASSHYDGVKLWYMGDLAK